MSSTFRYAETEQTTGATTTAKYVVNKHYENLPYPAFNTTDLTRDKEHYENHDTFAIIYPSATLENYNHFLHQGNKSFRCVHNWMELI